MLVILAILLAPTSMLQVVATVAILQFSATVRLLLTLVIALMPVLAIVLATTSIATTLVVLKSPVITPLVEWVITIMSVAQFAYLVVL
jgi:hypothetical protein